MAATVPTLKTERLILRGWRESDFAPLAVFYAQDPGSVFVGGPRRGKDVAMWFMARFGHWALRGYGSFVVTERARGTWLGWCGVNHEVGADEPSIQWALASQHRGKGYMTEAGRVALDDIFKASGRASLRTTIHPKNPSSQATARRLGGAPTGAREIDDGETVDVWRFAPVGGVR